MALIPSKHYTRKDIARQLSKAPVGLSIERSDLILKWLFEILGTLLSESAIGTRIEIRDFGILEIIKRKGRTLNTPMVPTKEIPDRRHIRFRAGKNIKLKLWVWN